MFRIKSSLGSFLRSDEQDWTSEWHRAAVFSTEQAANDWITRTYGRNGHKFFRAVTGWVDDGDVAEQD